MQDFRRLAAQTNRIVTMRPRPLGYFPHGVDVYVHPADYTPPERREGATGESDDPPLWWAAWLAHVGDGCQC